MNKLDLGCGNTKLAGSVGIDINKNSKADIIFNLERGIPFPSNQFDFVYSNHFFEHIDPKRLVFLLEEIWRVTKKGGSIEIHVPHFSGVGAYSNPTHMRMGFSTQTFSYFKSKNEYSKQISFQLTSVKLKKLKNRKIIWNCFVSLVNFFANINPTFCEIFWVYWVGGFDDLEFKLKPQK